MPVLVPGLADRCVVVNGVAKTYAMTGWRVGWLIGPTDVVKAATNLQSHATSNVANVSQVAALAAVSGDLSAVDEMKVAFDRRRQLIVGLLDAIPGVACPMPEGAFYVYPSVKGLLGRTLRGTTVESSAQLAGRHPRRGRGGGRAGRGLRHPGLPAPVVRDVGRATSPRASGGMAALLAEAQ